MYAPTRGVAAGDEHHGCHADGRDGHEGADGVRVIVAQPLQP